MASQRGRSVATSSLVNTRPLSWSVDTVCSPRPSDPKASQQARSSGRPWRAATDCTRRSVSRSFRWLISAVICRDCTPWPSRWPASCRMRPAASCSAGRPSAARIRLLTCLSDSRLSASTSRSETMLTRRPASVTGTCRMPWRDISSTASCKLWSCVRHCTGALITLEIGTVSGCCGSVMRPSTSWRVRMPCGAPWASSTTTDPTRRACMLASASASGVSAAQANGCLGASVDSGASSDCSDRACADQAACTAWRDRARNCNARRFRKSANGAQSAASRCTAAVGNSRQKVSSLAV